MTDVNLDDAASSDDRSEVGVAMLQARQALGLTLQQVSYALGGKPLPQSLSSYEHHARPPRDVLERLEELYQVTDHRLLAKAGYVLGLDEWQQSVENQLTVLRMDYERRTGRSVDVDVDALLTAAEREKRKNRQRPGAAR